MTEYVILVDENDNQIGLGEKMDVHRKGLLHRCISVFVFDSIGRMLLQQRAFSKYHSRGLWSNAVCSHQREGEPSLSAAHRRLDEEMGFDCHLEEVFSFTYKAELDTGLIEHEFDHVLIGKFDGAPVRNPEEVAAWKYIEIEDLKSDIKEHPENYTEWFKIVLPKVLEWKKL